MTLGSKDLSKQEPPSAGRSTRTKREGVVQQQESPSEFSAFVDRHHDYLRRKALVLTGNPAAADDLLQDTMERALRAFDDFAAEPGRQLAACERRWLATIMTRRFIDLIRRTKQEVREVEDALPAPEPYAPAQWEMVTAGQVQLAAQRLAPKFREVFELYHFQRASYQQIATRLQIPKNTVGVRLVRARDKVRKLLSEAKENK